MESMSVKRLLLMALLHFIVMYFLMYSMVDRIDSVYLNLNNAYMAALMTAPMIIIEGFLMNKMYENKKALRTLIISSVVLLVTTFWFIREQIAITDKEFLRSMIPHHSGAILMCRRAKIEDQRIQSLCRTIIDSQQSEINQMKQFLVN